ncbi:MAG: T3SS effector HopA1 family protein [Cytophagales bacterium]|nr:T3SS effector HopA1 family protein [Cytophagales bacterium]
MQQKTIRLLLSNSKPLQPKFKAAQSTEIINAHPLNPRTNPVITIPPMSLFLHDIHHEFSSGERIIGLPNGLFRTANAIQDANASEHFDEMINWLYNLWDSLHDSLMSSQNERLHLQTSIYASALEKNSPLLFPRESLLIGLYSVFSDCPPHIKCKWQNSRNPFFPAKLLSSHPELDLEVSPFLYISNQTKKLYSPYHTNYRLYINSVPKHIHSVVHFLINQVLLSNDFPHSYTIKLANHSLLSRRKDNVILYTGTPFETTRVIELIKVFQQSHPAFFENETPALTQKVAKGLGFAHTPNLGYEPASGTIAFDYDSHRLDRLLETINSPSTPAMEEFAKLQDVREIVDEMEQKKNNPLLPAGRSEAIGKEKMSALFYKHIRHVTRSFPELTQLQSSIGHSRALGSLVSQPAYNSFLHQRSHLIAQALLDSLLSTRDPNLFICKVWKYFNLGKADFFEPHKNQEQIPLFWSEADKTEKKESL